MMNEETHKFSSNIPYQLPARPSNPSVHARPSHPSVHVKLEKKGQAFKVGNERISKSGGRVLLEKSNVNAALPPLGLAHHTHIVTSVDAPNAVVFVSLIFHSASAPPYTPDERTKTMLARVAASGSLWEDAADFEVPDPFARLSVS